MMRLVSLMLLGVTACHFPPQPPPVAERHVAALAPNAFDPDYVYFVERVDLEDATCFIYWGYGISCIPKPAACEP